MSSTEVKETEDTNNTWYNSIDAKIGILDFEIMEINLHISYNTFMVHVSRILWSRRRRNINYSAVKAIRDRLNQQTTLTSLFSNPHST